MDAQSQNQPTALGRHITRNEMLIGGCFVLGFLMGILLLCLWLVVLAGFGWL